MKRRIALILTAMMLISAMLVAFSGCGAIFDLFDKEEESTSELVDTSKKDDTTEDTKGNKDTEANKDTQTNNDTEEDDDEEDADTQTNNDTEKDADEDDTVKSDSESKDEQISDDDIQSDVEDDEEDEEDDDEEEEEESEVLTEYNREPEDFDGFTLDVLTVVSGTWKMHTDFAPDMPDGTTINSAIFTRNEKVKAMYNVNIVGHEDAEYYHMTEKIAMDSFSGTPKYDAAYAEGSSVVSLVSQGQLRNLYKVDGIQLDEVWWSQLVKEEATLGSGKYATLNFIQSNLSLTAFDLTWCVYYNKQMQDVNQVQDLYELVETNEWTIENMRVIAKSVATLGSASSFTYDANGDSIYGITTYWNGAKAMLDGCKVQFITTDGDGEYIANIPNERFINLTQKLASLFGEAGTFTFGGPSTDGSTTGNADDYLKIFNNERAFFCVAEVKSCVKDFNDFKQEFGILPLPMLDSDQEEYRSWVNYLAPVLVVPSCTDDDSAYKTGVLLDVLSFYSEKDVLPQYYDKVLKGRGTSDPQSLKMLDLINSTKTFDASIAYGWSRQFSEVLSQAVLQGVTDVSSMAETYEPLINELIKQTMDTIFE